MPARAIVTQPDDNPLERHAQLLLYARELRAVLKQYQWASPPHEESDYGWCPSCGASQGNGTHGPGCAIAKVLAATDVPVLA